MINLNVFTTIAPNATATNKVTVASSSQYTLDGARSKVVAKLQANIAFINNKMKAVNSDKLDLVFKLSGNDTYTVGAKYGNRWLADLFGDKVSYVNNIKQAELVDVLTAIADAVKAGDADGAITAVHENNKRNKAA